MIFLCRNKEMMKLDEIFLSLGKSIVYADIFSFVNLSLHTSSFKVIWHTHMITTEYPDLTTTKAKYITVMTHAGEGLSNCTCIRNKAEIIRNRGQKNFPLNFCQTSNGASSKIRGSRAWFFSPVRCFFAECPRKHSVLLCDASLRSLTRFFLAIFYTNIHKIAGAFARTQRLLCSESS